jgi:hypothetical protein
MSNSSPSHRDCNALDRRNFLKAAAGASALATIGSGLWTLPGAYAAPSPTSAAETAVGQFYNSLSAEQKKTICFSFNDPLRQKINANWHITKPTVGNDFYTKEQRQLVDQIVQNVTSKDGYERLKKQMEFDSGGIQDYSIAVFGEPGTPAFEWELTGRHLTLRADGNSVDGAAFGGPIIYGHGEENPKENLFFYQTQQVNEVFKALDANQSKQALVATAPNEAAVALQGESGNFSGISVSQLSPDQKKLVEKTLQVLLAPYRQEDADEAMEIVKSAGGTDKLHMAFYQNGDLGNDKVWDMWRVEGPAFVWNFRGAPHVHAYINIGMVGAKPKEANRT